MTGEQYYDQLGPPPDKNTSWIVRFFTSFYYGKYVKFPTYDKQEVDDGKKYLFKWQNYFGSFVECFMLFVGSMMLFLQLLLILICAFADVRLLPGEARGAYCVLFIFYVVLIPDMIWSFVLWIIKLVAFCKRRPKDMSRSEWFGKASMFEPPPSIKAKIDEKTKNTWLHDCACGFWPFFHLFRGAGISFTINRWLYAIFTMINLLDPNSSFANVFNPVILPFYLAIGLYSIFEMGHSRVHYYFQKKLQYIQHLDEVIQKIETGNHSAARLKHLEYERDRVAWRMFKQKPKIGVNMQIITLNIFVTISLVSNAIIASFSRASATFAPPQNPDFMQFPPPTRYNPGASDVAGAVFGFLIQLLFPLPMIFLGIRGSFIAKFFVS